MWIPIGLDELENQEKENKYILSRKAITPLFNQLRLLWKDGFHDQCEIIFGVTVTRKYPLNLKVRDSLTLQRQPEIFTVKIKGQGPGIAPLVSNHIYKNKNTYRTSLPLTNNSESNLEVILDLIMASSAFPLAFSPYPIRFCFHSPGEEQSSCNLKDSGLEEFVDGGIYQNSPVDHGYEILNEVSSAYDSKELIYVNASAPLHNQSGELSDDEKSKEADPIDEALDLGFNFLQTSRNLSLTQNLQKYPDLSKNIKTNSKQIPLVSEPLYAFFGFIEKDFRIADFYLGILDASKIFPNEKKSTSKEYECFVKRLSGNNECVLDENLTILSRLSKLRRDLYPNSQGLEFLMNYLQQNHFHFRDLKLRKKESKFGKVALKNRLKLPLLKLAENRPESSKFGTKLIFEQALNQVSFYPSARYAYALWGDSPELGISLAYKKELNIPTTLRLNFSLMFQEYVNKFKGQEENSALVPLMGFRYQPEKLGNSMWQINFGARAGYVLVDSDNGGSKKELCDPNKFKTSTVACSGFTTQLVTAITFIERARVQVVYIPDSPNQIGKFMNPVFYLQFGIVIPDFWN